MKKFYIIFSYIISFCLILFFSVHIFLKHYFNNYFYYIPNVVGLTMNEAEALIPKGTVEIMEMGKDFSNLPEGEIFMQEPAENKIVKKGRTIRVWVSAGENIFQVPDFYGQQLFEVRTLLEEKGIKIKDISRTDSELAYNCVITTTPGKGEYVDADEGISILVSSRASSKIVRVPDLAGYTLEEAEAKLKEQSLFVGNITTMEVPGLESNIVVETGTEAGSKISAGSNIDLIISK